MRKLIVSLMAGVLPLAAVQALAADKVTLQLSGATHSQFGGYYLAKDKGQYAAQNLDVEIKVGGPNIEPEQVIASGGADVIVTSMSAALIAREKGVPLVNIAQPFAASALMMVCWADGPVKSEADLKGKTLGVLFSGNEYPFFAWMKKLGLSTEGGPDGVTVLKQNDAQPLIQKQADCISARTYKEWYQLVDAGYNRKDVVQFRYSEMGNDLLEDGLYVLEPNLADPAFADKMVRFVRASMQGWKAASWFPGIAADIVVANGGDVKWQAQMANEVAELINQKWGELHEPLYKRTVQALLDQKVIMAEPKGAWTAAITDQAPPTK